MLKIVDPVTARRTILRRSSWGDGCASCAGCQPGGCLASRLTPRRRWSASWRDVRARGDAALQEWTSTAGWGPPGRVPRPRGGAAGRAGCLPAAQRHAFELAAGRVRRFHEPQPLTSWMTQELGGTLGQLIRPIRRVGLYVPAGTAPLPSTVLMSAIPAQVAGVKEIVLVAPPDRENREIAAGQSWRRPRCWVFERSMPWAGRRPSPRWPLARRASRRWIRSLARATCS